MDYYSRFLRTYSLPEFWNDPVERAAQICNHTDGNLFAFITDIHVHSQSMVSVPLLRALAEKTRLQNVFCGGDLPWAFGTREECLNDGIVALECLSKIKDSMKLYLVRGNHDFTIRHERGASTGYTAPYEWTVDIMKRYQSAGAVGALERLYYYVDDAAARIRYVVCDTCKKHTNVPEDTPWGCQEGIDVEQLRWLSEEALVFDERGNGWTVVVMGHIPCVAGLPSYCAELEPLACLLKDFKNHRNGRYGDFSNCEAELAAYICGHNHKDRHCVEDGVLFISTGCSARLNDDGVERWSEVETETIADELFDIYILDTKKRILKAVRMGVGEDREFSY